MPSSHTPDMLLSYIVDNEIQMEQMTRLELAISTLARWCISQLCYICIYARVYSAYNLETKLHLYHFYFLLFFGFLYCFGNEKFTHSCYDQKNRNQLKNITTIDIEIWLIYKIYMWDIHHDKSYQSKCISIGRNKWSH